MFRYNYLNAVRDLPPHPFVLELQQHRSGPQREQSCRSRTRATRSTTSSIRSRASSTAGAAPGPTGSSPATTGSATSAQPFSAPFPTIEIGERRRTYTTAGHEPFSIHNILDQDVFQLTNNFSVFSGRHTLTFGAQLRVVSASSTRSTSSGTAVLPALHARLPARRNLPLAAQLLRARPTPDNPDQLDLNAYVGTGPVQGREDQRRASSSFYAQDEFLVDDRFTLTAGLRVDVPIYFTDRRSTIRSRATSRPGRERQPGSRRPERAARRGRRCCHRAWASTGTPPATARPRSAAAPASSPAGSRSCGWAT